MPIAILGLGSNLGDKEENLNKAIKELETSCKILKKSTFIITEPVGYLDQDNFLNGALEIETNLSPLDLLMFLKSIEKKLKRKKTIVNGPRTIDLDIILYDDLILNTKELIIPHPRFKERLFVLTPLNQIIPNMIDPTTGLKINQIWEDRSNKI